MRKVELLAPAGNEAALHAAVAGGADAVYLGLGSFNARRGADNFTIDTLRSACEYAHMRGVSIYVTMNTVILPGEVAEALECVRQAYRAGADGFIVQDIGLAAEITRTLPEASLHLSTQMNTHNLAGVRAAARLGAERITLARELSLPEVALLCAAAEEEGMEVEVFAHGALCVCYSGQCFMSSMIGGRSANRGMCAQACRLPYELKNAALQKELPSPGDHLLSPQDLCTVDMVPQLVEAGVASLKIEGRMKSPEYVYAVTSVYRKALDTALAACACTSGTDSVGGDLGRPSSSEVDPAITDADRDRLTDAFSRGFTTAYLDGKRGNDIMSYKRPNNRGLFLGRVDEVRDSAAFLKSDHVLAEGDVLEFWTRKGNGTLTLGPVRADKKGRYHLPLEGKTRMVKPGDRVFRVRSAEAAFEDDAREPRVPIVGTATLHIGEPLSIEFRVATEGEVLAAFLPPDVVPGADAGALPCHPERSAAGAEPKDLPNLVRAALPDELCTSLAVARRLGDAFPDGAPLGIAEGLDVEAARTRAVSFDDVAAHIDRLGNTPYQLVNLTIDMDDNVGIGFSQLHHARAEALDCLQLLILAGTIERPLPRVAAREPLPAAHPAGCRVAVTVTNPACARAAKRAGAHIIYVPALNYRRGEAVIAGQRNAAAEQAGYPKGCIPIMPVVDHEATGMSREAAVAYDVWKYVDAGKPLMAESLASLERAAEEDAVISVGAHLPVTNELSLRTVRDFGAERVWLSPELTLRQIEELSKDAPVELGVLLIGAQELMVTEHCMLMSQGPCDEDCAVCPRRKSPHYLRDRKGFEFPVVTDCFGRSHLYNSVELDVASSMPELLAAGVSSYMVDATLMNAEETAHAVGRAIRALHVAQNDGNAIAKMPNTTSGHLYRGVS
ncbi:U32 family peptidase [Adlercreutzia sp. R21]|uniref:U32 family peptidase n=1 Tax=Adlercreutzia wanghongyangiae TaxID=3111451 RepID=UPI002DBA9671|nr:U32 family peptidase [Adlercreutzia sp. R21]MEC4183479.1 U32 family peptidase [Adlercreutzia sp. R21]